PNRIAWRRLDARSRHARYLVLIVALGLRDHGRRDPREILSNQCARYCPRYYFLLGGSHDHCRPRAQARQNGTGRGQHSLSRRFFDRVDSRYTGPEDVEMAWYFSRSARSNCTVRCWCFAVRLYAVIADLVE